MHKTDHSKPSQQARSMRREAPASADLGFGRFNPEAGLTGIEWLDSLPLGDYGQVDPEGPFERVAFAGARSPAEITNLIFRLTTQSFLMSRSFAGSPDSAPRTDHFVLNGVDRFWIDDQKLRGPVRKEIARATQQFNTTPCGLQGPQYTRMQCGRCFVCRLFGYLGVHGNSRITFSEMISEQQYQPQIVTSVNQNGGRPFIKKRDMVPPGVRFWGVISIRRPTRLDLGNVLAALKLVGACSGIGSETTHYGRFSVDIVAIIGGYLTTLGGPLPLAEAGGRLGGDADAVIREAITAMPFEPIAVIGDEARHAADRLERLSPLSVKYGEEYD